MRRVPDRCLPRQVSDALLCGQLVIGSRGQGWGSGACTEGRGRPCTAVWRLRGTALNQLHGRVKMLRIGRVIIKQDVVIILVAGLHIQWRANSQVSTRAQEAETLKPFAQLTSL